MVREAGTSYNLCKDFRPSIQVDEGDCIHIALRVSVDHDVLSIQRGRYPGVMIYMLPQALGDQRQGPRSQHKLVSSI